MSLVTTASVVIVLLGSALIGGVFFAFSSFVMKALGRLPTAEGIAAMQSVNVVVLNPSFLCVFMGTAVFSLLVAAFAVQGWDTPSAPWLLAGAMLYLFGTFLVTGLGNIPLNDQLAAVTDANSNSITVWEHYLDQWTRLNTIRTVAAAAAALAFTFGLIQR